MTRLRSTRVAALLLTAALVGTGCGGARSHGAAGPTTTLAETVTTSPSRPTPNSTSTSTRPTGEVGAQRDEAPLPSAIQEAAAATTGDRLYVVGGYDTARNSSAAVFVGDGTRWRAGPALPIAVNHPGAAVIGGDVYVAGGFTPNGATNRMFVLAEHADHWRELAPMHRARGALALLALGRHLFAIGGRDRSLQIAVPEVYDPATGAWSDLPAMPDARNHVAGYVEGSQLCVAGGRTPLTSAGIDCFDPSTSTWRHRGTLPTGTSGAAAAVVDGVTYVAGGEPAGETSIVGVIQVLRNGSWSSVPMLVPRHGAAFSVFRGRLWACGGATAPGFHAVSVCTSIGAVS